MNKKKIDIRIPIIIVLSIILTIMLFFYFKEDDKVTNTKWNYKNNSTTSSKTKISATSQVSSSLTETLDLHATYYLKKVYVSEGDKIKAGTNILRYKNGQYFKAPYDGIIVEMKIPDEGKKVTNSHYIKYSAINVLKVEFKVDETKIKNLSIGDKATITFDALNGKTLEGVITDIESKATKGKFNVRVEFDNDGDIMIGMTANVTI